MDEKLMTVIIKFASKFGYEIIIKKEQNDDEEIEFVAIDSKKKTIYFGTRFDFMDMVNKQN